MRQFKPSQYDTVKVLMLGLQSFVDSALRNVNGGARLRYWSRAITLSLFDSPDKLAHRPLKRANGPGPG